MDEEKPQHTIDATTQRLLTLTKPSFWNAHMPDNAEVQTEIEARKMLFAVAEYTRADMDSITVIDFYSLMNHLEEKHKNG